MYIYIYRSQAVTAEGRQRGLICGRLDIDLNEKMDVSNPTGFLLFCLRHDYGWLVT